MSGVENDEIRDRRASRVEERTAATTNDQQDAPRPKELKRKYQIPANDGNSVWITYLSDMSIEPSRSISMGGKDWSFLSPATHGRVIFLGGLYSVVKTMSEKSEADKDKAKASKKDSSYVGSNIREREENNKPWWKFWASSSEKAKPIDHAKEAICGSFAASRINSFKGAQRAFLTSSLSNDKVAQKTNPQAPPVLYFVSQEDAKTQRDKMVRKSFNVPATSFRVASVPLKIAVEQVYSKIFEPRNQISLSYRINDLQATTNFGHVIVPRSQDIESLAVENVNQSMRNLPPSLTDEIPVFSASGLSLNLHTEVVEIQEDGTAVSTKSIRTIRPYFLNPSLLQQAIHTLSAHQALEASYSRRAQRERRRLKAKSNDGKGGTDDNEKDSGQHNSDSSENLVEEDRELSDLDKMSEELTDLGGNVDNDPELISMLSEIDNPSAKTSSNDSNSTKINRFNRLEDDIMDLCDRFFLENQVGRRVLGIDEMYIETKGLSEVLRDCVSNVQEGNSHSNEISSDNSDLFRGKDGDFCLIVGNP